MYVRRCLLNVDLPNKEYEQCIFAVLRYMQRELKI